MTKMQSPNWILIPAIVTVVAAVIVMMRDITIGTVLLAAGITFTIIAIAGRKKKAG